MIGAYITVPAFAYSGWRLTIPGGPAGGHYKGFTHTESAGTDIPPEDQYEQDREDGISSHDAVHSSLRNPRGVYRSSAEVPPRPNASGAAMTYRGFQTERHAGTSVAPGSFPAEFFETDEDAFLAGLSGDGLGATRMVFDGPGPLQLYESDAGGVAPISQLIRAGTFNYGEPDAPPIAPNTVYSGAPAKIIVPAAPATGATSVVRQPAGSLYPAPPAPAVPVHVEPPISPRPAPVIATREVLPLHDGSGNFFHIATGETVSASDVEQNPATGQFTAPGGGSWLEEHSIFSALPNWGVLVAGFVGASLLLGKRR